MLPFLVGVIADIAIPALIGGVIGAGISLAIEGIMNKRKLKQLQEDGTLGDAIKIAAKTHNSIKIDDLENDEQIEIQCNDGVADDIHVGDYIYNYS